MIIGGILVLLFGMTNILLLGRFELCIFRSFFGIPCPGCGMVHAAQALFLEFDLVKSLEYHPFFLPTSITLFFSLFPFHLWKVANKLVEHVWWQRLLLTLILFLYCYRMIRYFPSDNYPMVFRPRNYLSLGYSVLQTSIETLIVNFQYF